MKKILIIMIGIMMMVPGILLASCSPKEVSIIFYSSEKYSIEKLTEQVEYGKDYSFKVLLKNEYCQSEIVVKSNGDELERVEDVYTIEKVEEDQIVEIEGIEKNTYTVNFYNGEIFKSIQVEYGAEVNLEEIPIKEADKEYIYTFKEWIDETGNPVDLTSVTKNIEAYATYQKKQVEYKIIKLPTNVIVKKESQILSTTDVLHYGEELTIEVIPQEGYEIIGLQITGVIKEGDTYRVEDNISVKLIEKKKSFSVTWKNKDKVLKVDNVEYGTVPEYVGETPQTYVENEETYIFIGWGEITKVTEDVVYEAKYKKLETYTASITFDNEEFRLVDNMIIDNNGGVYGIVEIESHKFTENSKVIVKFYLSCLSEEIEIRANGETCEKTREELEDEFLSIYTIEFNIQENTEISLSGFIEEILF